MLGRVRVDGIFVSLHTGGTATLGESGMEKGSGARLRDLSDQSLIGMLR